MPDSGSLGASANLELELDSGAVSDPDRLRQQVRYLFGLAKASVEEELNQQQAALPHTPPNGHSPAASTSGNGHHHASSNGQRLCGAVEWSCGHGVTGPRNQDHRRSPAAADLAAQLEPFGVQAVEDLSIQQASQMIDELKAEPVGAGGSR
ncbi:MAG: hypothetical protein U0935_20355 [Pirellulales bacterium]